VKSERASLGEVQPPRVDFAKDLDYVRRRRAVRRDGSPQLDQQITVREFRQRRACIRHDPL
jgi:hypothetical protein